MYRSRGLTSILPPEMEGRTQHDGGPQRAVSQSIAFLPSTATEPGARHMERRASAGNLRTSTIRPSFTNVPTTIRTVTPEPPANALTQEGTGIPYNHNATAPGPGIRGFGSLSPQSSPRAIPAGGPHSASGRESTIRRQGVVFNDAIANSFDSTSSSPPPRTSPFRSRTHTMDGALRQQLGPAFENTRHRVSSFSSAGSVPGLNDDLRGPPLPPLNPPPNDSLGYPSVQRTRSPDQQLQPALLKEKKSATRTKLMKRTSRPTSPLISPPPSVDSLPLPIPTNDANKVLLFMKTLCGRMNGQVEYQLELGGPWHRGICYIDEEKGSLMFDPGENGPFHIAVIHDLRGCRVLPVEHPEKEGRCLELTSCGLSTEFLLWPVLAEQFDLWLAALLCWQQLRPAGPRGPVLAPVRPELKRRGSSTASKEANIIKVGKVMLWDKGAASSPRAIVKRPSTRDLRSNHTSWRKVSSILQDNGELKLITENDVTILSVIDLSQLNRCAIQQLDKTVLDEEYCIAIFPIYSTTATHLSVFRPVYIALDSRVLFEVWFVLLRAFTVPELYAVDLANDGQLIELLNLNDANIGDAFRVEKTVTLRITEAKVKSRTLDLRPGVQDYRHHKNEPDPLVGNYLAEVVLDSEVRARTTIKTDTKNPFWRDECEFSDLPSSLPYVSIVLKRVEGNLDSFSHQLQASMGLSKSGNLLETPCGAVEIPLSHIERGKDHEQWFQIYDERQQSIGSMLVKVHHAELVVLLAKDYQPLSEVLHKFSSGLTGQIASVLPGSLRKLAEIFLNIFQVSGNVSEWLMALVEEEIDGIGNPPSLKSTSRFSRRLRSNESADSASDRVDMVRDMGKSLAGEANLLFRGNSLLTQALEFHMRRLGKEYMTEVLGEKIFEINEINPNCEVDPGKLQSGEDINQHWSQLMLITNEIWECIVSSADKLPGELRHILKYIRAVAEDRYGDFLRTVSYTSVSGFLFLRFICPAILNPKLFGLLRDHPRPRAQRTLTLIAKVLQSLANLSTIGKKESWMDPMNKFLNTQRVSLKTFIDQVCAIPAERASHTLSASYSTPITILGRLTPTAREGFPSLPYLIDHARNFAALAKLWVDANPISTSEPPSADEPLVEFNMLCHGVQQRADACFAKMEAVRLADTASQPTESELGLTDALERTHLNVGYGTSPSWLEHDSGFVPPGSSGSEMEAADRTARERWGRESSSLRHVSGSSEVSSQPGTIRSLRSGKHARKFLSGFMRKGRNPSPDASASSSAAGKEKEKERDKDKDKSRGNGGFTADPWQGS